MTVDLLPTSHAGDLGSNPGGGLTWVTPMKEEEISKCKSHISSVRFTDRYIMF